MASNPHSDLTRLLADWSEGDPEALDELIPLVYEELHRLARQAMRRERVEHTLQPTALVHEAYVRLAGQQRARWHNRAQFFAVAAKVMRRILVDHARSRRYAKRAGVERQIGLEETVLAATERPAELVALDDALRSLEAADPRKGQVTELRVFGGLTIPETAATLGISTGTVISEYRYAKAWLFRELRRDSPEPEP